MSFFDFLIFCSGADKSILYDDACPKSERNKYASIGATILLTASLAVFTGGYAMNFVFENTFISIVLGILWGIIIFNLDRYIVLSLRKEKIPTKTDIISATSQQQKDELSTERNRLLWNQALMASPRFLIAFVIAITISKPLELRLFSTRIMKAHAEHVRDVDSLFDIQENRRIADLNQDIQALNNKEQTEKQNLYAKNAVYNDALKKIPENKTEIKSNDQTKGENDDIIGQHTFLRKSTRRKFDKQTNTWYDQEYSYWEKDATAREKEKENEKLTEANAKLVKENDEYSDKKKQIEKDLDAQSKQIASQYDLQRAPILQSINGLKETYRDRKQEYVSKIKYNPDILERLEYLGLISKLFNPVWWASFVISLLFILLEIAPVTVKLLTKRGPYDNIVDRIEYETYLEQQKIISNKNDEVNNLLQSIRQINKLKIDLKIKTEKTKVDAELKANESLLEDISTKMAELAKLSVNKWYKEELDKIKNNSTYNYAKTKQQTPPKQQPTHQNAMPTVTLIGKKWQEKTTGSDVIYYVFNNGKPTGNEVVYEINGNIHKGTWDYIVPDKEIRIDLNNGSDNYVIDNLTENTVNLKTSKNVIELIKA